MVKVDLTGCDSFVGKEQFQAYVEKALAAQVVLEEESGAGNDFLGWQHLPSAIGKDEIADCLGVVDRWLAKDIDLVVVIGIGGSYLGAKAAIEALSHTFANQLGTHGLKVVFAGENLSEDYTAELLVPTSHPSIAESVEEAGLYSIKGGSLVEIVRFDKEIIMPVSPDEPLMGGDRLVYAGQINEILELKRSHGLVAADHHVWNINEIDSRRKMRTAYVDFGSDLIDTKMTESDFEKENDVVLVAVARSGKRVEGQPREIQLQAGDTLLLECPPGNDRQLEQDNRRRITFFDSHFVPQTGPRTLVASIVLVMMFLLSSFHVMPLMATTMLAAGAMLLFRCCRMDRVVKYIEWDMLLILGSTVVFSTAIAKTGITDAVANGILDLCGTNPYVVMAVTCLLASVVTEFVSDVGSAAVFFPIIWQQAQMLDCNPMPFVISLMLSVAISYASPIGSSTHILIYGPGSFRFTDFVRLGTIMHIVLLIVCLVLVNVIYPLYIY